MTLSTNLEELIRKAKEVVDAMTPEQREEMYRKQRDNWVKAELQWAKDFREWRCQRD